MFNFLKKSKKADLPAYEESADKIASIRQGDTTLQEFKKKAQEELPYLIEFMLSHERDEELYKYAVKCDFVEGDNSEHMWVQVHDFVDGLFEGRLANEPNTIKKLKYGDPVAVVPDDVEDWILMDLLTNTKVGGFSSGYIRSKSNQTE